MQNPPVLAHGFGVTSNKRRWNVAENLGLMTDLAAGGYGVVGGSNL